MLYHILNNSIFIVYFSSVVTMNSCTVTLLLALFIIIIAVILQIECQDSPISDTLECDPVARKNYTSPA